MYWIDPFEVCLQITTQLTILQHFQVAYYIVIMTTSLFYSIILAFHSTVLYLCDFNSYYRILSLGLRVIELQFAKALISQLNISLYV